MRLEDKGARYGAVSIALHWVTATVVLALLFIGDSIAVSGDAMLRLHTSVALLAVPLLVARIGWRVRQGHAARLPRQKRLGFEIGKLTHYALLGGIALMIVSGPAMAWAGNIPVRLFDWVKMVSVYPHPGAFTVFHTLHGVGATLIGYGTLLHMAGVLKHSIFDKDGTFEKIMLIDDPIDPGHPPVSPPS